MPQGGNGKFSEGPRTWADLLHSNPGVLALVFAATGTLGFLGILQLAGFVLKHTATHRAYTEYVLIGLLLGALVGALYFFHVFRQIKSGAMDLYHSLRWWHWMWAILFISGLVFRKRTAAEGVAAPVDSAAVFRIGLVGGVGLVLLCALFLRRLEWTSSVFRGIVGGLIAFDLAALLSTVWSVYWQWTFYKAIEYGVDVCMLAVILIMARTSKDFKRLFDWTWILYAALLLNVWFGCVWDPKDTLLKGGLYGVQGIGGLGVWLQGVWPDVSSNQIGEYAACITAVALCRLLPLNRKRENLAWNLTVFGFGFITVIFAQTRSALGGFCLAVFLIYLLSSRVGQGATIVISSLVVTFVSGFGSVVMDYIRRGQSQNQLDSFSSRMEWWQAALEKFELYPLTGLGMWAAARYGVLAKIGLTQTATIHSDWVEITVGMGVWGLIPALFVLITAWYYLIRFTASTQLPLYERQLAYEGMAVMSVVSVRMFFMTDLSLHPPLHFFAALGAAEFLRRRVNSKEPWRETDSPAQLSAAAGV